MNRNIIRIAAAAVLGLGVVQGAIAAPSQDAANSYTNGTLRGGNAYVGGSGENESVAYAGTRPQGVTAAPARITGSGENISVELPAPTFSAPSAWVAVIDGSGENQSVRYVPRG